MNTYENVINYLEQHRKLSYDIEYYRNKMGGLKAISYSEEEKGTSMQDTMSLYMQKIEKAEEKQREIEEFIDANFLSVGRLVLYERYVKYKTLKEVSDKIGFSCSYTKKILGKTIYGYLAR